MEIDPTEAATESEADQAVSALTHKRWLYVGALVATALCVLMGLSGLAGWHVHPAEITNLLS